MGRAILPCPFYMRKMINSDIIKEAYEELEEQYGDLSPIIDKTAFNININPANVVGAITGAAVAKRQMTQNMLKQQIESDNRSVLSGGYYKQVDNIANNLKVIFTPFSVIYVVKNGPQETTLDTIDTEEMDNDMYSAYKSRNAGYFKRLLLNKINSEVQLAEQMFARRMVQKQLELENHMNNKNTKQASTDSDVSFSDLLSNICGAKTVFEKNANSLLGDFFIKALGGNSYDIQWGLDDIRPLSKYAGLFKDTLNFFGLNLDKNNIRELQGKMMEPNYLKRKLKIGFLPNRVAFIVDNMVITQLPVMGMNDEGFEAFQKEDQEYFKDLFENELKKNTEIKMFKPPITKQAAEDKKEIREIFIKSDIHPKLYETVLDKTFGRDWIDLDPAVLIKEIEEKFSIKDGIVDSALNKILVLQLVNKSFEPFMNAHVFEKCVRAMNDKPIDFLARETNFGLGELIFALKIIQDTTPADDIYDNFSEAVFAYVADILTLNEYRVALPEFVVNSKNEEEFYKTLNAFITSKWNDIISEGLEDKKKIENIKKENALISSASIKLISTVRKAGEYNPKAIEDISNKVLGRLTLPNHVKNIILNTVKDNMATDIYLQYKDDLLAYQSEIYTV